MAIFAGGKLNGTYDYTTRVDILDTTSKVWTTASLSLGREGMAAVSAGSFAIIAGGAVQSTYCSTVDIYNSVSKTWFTSSLSIPRTKLAAAATSTGLAFFAGGINGSYTSASSYNSVVDVYNTNTNTWSIKSLSQARYWFAATTVGELLFFGGGSWYGGVSNIIDIYNVTSDTWSKNYLSDARCGVAAGTYANAAVFAGGKDPTFATKLVDFITTFGGIGSHNMLTARSDAVVVSTSNLVMFASGNYQTSTIDVYGTVHSTTGNNLMDIN